MGLLSSAVSMADEIEVDIKPIGMNEDESRAITYAILEHPQAKKRFEGVKHRVLFASFPEIEEKSEDSREFSAHFDLKVYDYTNNRLVNLASSHRSAGGIEIRESHEQPQPTVEEYEEAYQILASHPEFGDAIAAGHFRTYEAMPGIVEPLPGEEGRRSPDRVIAIGLEPTVAKLEHEIVGVDMTTGEVIRYENGAPPTALATLDHCGYANAYQPNTARGTSGSALITVNSGTTQLWQFTVVRPSASGGSEGSAIDLRQIKYKGKLALSRLSVPILNVNYDGNVCGPYRDWQYSENPFDASGSNMAPGVRRATAPAQTIFEDGTDAGNFRGVAVYTSGTKTILVTELSAGWYRYISEYRFDQDGTIEPVFKFSAVSNSCVCQTHHHHVYWRMDFDIDGGTSDLAQTYNGSSWVTNAVEAKQFRNSSNRAWRVLNPATGRGYQVVPGAQDGTANAYGMGDAWWLRYRDYQYDDSRVRNSTRAALDAFVTGESIQNTDVVLWYAGHFTHAPGEEEYPHLIGPTLKAVNW